MIRPQPASLTSWQPRAWWAAAGAWTMLLVVLLAWEMVIAPLRPGGSWLVIKTIPLVIALPGILRASAYTMQWTTMLVLLYIAEAIVRIGEPPPVRWLAVSELVIALVYFVAALAYLQPLKRAARSAARSQ